jgi:hypothetical protein
MRGEGGRALGCRPSLIGTGREQPCPVVYPAREQDAAAFRHCLFSNAQTDREQGRKTKTKTKTETETLRTGPIHPNGESTHTFLTGSIT